MMRDLFQFLSADRVDHRELQHVLMRYFPSASQLSLRTITFPGTDPWKVEYALKLEFSRKDRITAITACRRRDQSFRSQSDFDAARI